VGEYAAQSLATVSVKNRNTFACALGEATFMTGLERNADVVRMASYAPLFAHVDAWQWTPDLIWVDNLRTLHTPSYHVQSLLARNRGDRILPVALDAVTEEATRSLYASSSLNAATGEVIVKLVNALPKESVTTIELKGARQVTRATLTVLRADDLEAVNTFDALNRVAPRETAFAPAGTKFDLTLPASSFTVVRVGVLP
jgi:alpha-N-arabinofuranosidase